jgi:F-type H+-transporting ATPase subunit delta
MTSRAAATRIARTLFDVVRRNDPERVGNELAAVAHLVATHDDLQRAFANPAVPVAAKQKILAAVLQLQPVSDPVMRFLNILAERDRLTSLSEVADAYRQRLLDFQQVVRAEVTTAVPLAADRALALEQSLAQATGKRVLVTTQVDPSIIGGVVARIGSRVYDGSVAHHLRRVKAQLVESAQ